jgi:hypothetical protein
MQVTVKINAEESREIRHRLSELRARTRTLCTDTSDLERRLKGVTCSTLRLVLAAQRDELGRAEAELACIGPSASGTHRVTRAEPSPTRSTNRPERVDERASSLLDGHEAASELARSAARKAREVGNLPLYELLARRSDAHDEAAWTLAPLVLSSIVSCEVCASRRSCPLSAAGADDCLLSATLGGKVDGLTEAHSRSSRR